MYLTFNLNLKKFKENGFCLVFGVGWGWRCPQKKKKKKKKKNVEYLNNFANNSSYIMSDKLTRARILSSNEMISLY